jgi:hypothetical protein
MNIGAKCKVIPNVFGAARSGLSKARGLTLLTIAHAASFGLWTGRQKSVKKWFWQGSSSVEFCEIVWKMNHA